MEVVTVADKRVEAMPVPVEAGMEVVGTEARVAGPGEEWQEC